MNTTRTYSLAEAAVLICGSDAPAEREWLAKRLRGDSDPLLPGYKVARRWRMTQDDVDAAIELLRPKHPPTTEVARDEPVFVQGLRIPNMSNMSRTSRRRLLGSP